MGILTVRYTEEEREEFKREILKRLEKGYINAEIVEDIGISQGTVEKLINEIFEDPSINITREEVEARRQKRQREKRYQDPNVQLVIKGLKEKKNYSQIAKTAPISKVTVRNIAIRLMEDEEMRREIERAQEETSREQNEEPNMEETNDNQSDELSQASEKGDLKDRMLGLLNVGIGKLQIRSILGITPIQFDDIEGELINEKKITKKDIKKARETREKDNTEKIYSLRMQGLSYSEIAAKIEYADVSYVDKKVRKLINLGRLTKEANGEEVGVDTRQGFVLEMLVNRGLTLEEIAEEYNKTHSEDRLTKDMVFNISKKIISENEGIEERIESARVARRKEKKEENQADGEYDERIYKLFSLGFDWKQISAITDLGSTYIFTRKRVLKAQGREFMMGPKKLVASRETRAKKRRNAIAKMVAYEKEIDIEMVQDHIEYTKAKYKLGEGVTKDMQLISSAIPMQRELMELGHINFVIRYFMEGDYLRPAVNFINECLASVQDDEERKKRKINRNKRKDRKKNTRTRKGKKAEQTR